MARSKRYGKASLAPVISFIIVSVGLIGALVLFRIGPKIWPKASAPQTIDCQHQVTWDLSDFIPDDPNVRRVQGMAYLNSGGQAIAAIAVGGHGTLGRLVFYNLTANSLLANINSDYYCDDEPTEQQRLQWLFDVTSDGNYFYAYNYDNAISRYTIAKFRPNGTCISDIEILQGPTCGMGAGEGTAIDANGDIYVSRYSGDPYIGVYFASEDCLGMKIGASQIYDPRGLFVDAPGQNLYVANTESNNLTQFGEDVHHQTWSLRATISGLTKPRDVALSPSSKIYIAEQPGDEGIHNRIIRYESMTDPSAEYCGAYGEGDGQFNDPAAIVFNPTGQNEEFYVVDKSKRVQKFVWLLSLPTATPTFPPGVYLNSATGKSCNQICAENGKVCMDIGINPPATDNYAWRWVVDHCRANPIIQNQCAAAMPDTGHICQNASPDGRPADWTKCKCSFATD